MWKMSFEIFIESLGFETPWVRKNGSLISTKSPKNTFRLSQNKES